MKKFILLIATILLCSCSEISKVSDARNLPESGRTIYIERFEMDGHDWICFGDPTIFDVEHDPECLKRDMLDSLTIDPE